jgi:4-hydroxythreonine-4-phosphate dehydrogenase
MLAWTPHFKVVFVTIHLPLAEVSRHITAAAVLEKTRLLCDFLRREAAGGKHPARPRICVMALNPHAYEFSRGEDERIAEGVRRSRQAGINAVGPVPADAAAASVSAARYSGYVAMYHDQAMIPAKLLGRDQGVNVTLGPPFVRTSPLHGTAFDIAGRGIANPGSMLAAIRLARRLAR